MTTPLRLFVEAVVVAVAFLVIFTVIHLFAMMLAGDAAMTNHGYLAIQIALAASSFHVFCEVLGINDWYCNDRKSKDETE